MHIFSTQKGYLSLSLSLSQYFLYFCSNFYEVCTLLILLLTNLYVFLDASFFIFLFFYNFFFII